MGKRPHLGDALGVPRDGFCRYRTGGVHRQKAHVFPQRERKLRQHTGWHTQATHGEGRQDKLTPNVEKLPTNSLLRHARTSVTGMAFLALKRQITTSYAGED